MLGKNVSETPVSVTQSGEEVEDLTKTIQANTPSSNNAREMRTLGP